MATTPSTEGLPMPTDSDSEVRPTLEDKDLPAMYRASDLNAGRTQARFIRLTRASLISLVVAAIAGALVWKIGSTDWAGVIAAVAFVFAILVRLQLVRTKPDSEWHRSRTIAESTKTVAWRYAVGGAPFGKANDADVDARFLKRLEEILQDLPGPYLAPADNNPDEITDGMRNLRGQNLDVRKASYVAGRIDDQIEWYGKKTTYNLNHADFWENLLLILELFGVLAAILKATGLFEIDLLGITAAITAAVISWLQVRQHATLARSYTVAGRQLGLVRAKQRQLSDDEEEWARFVDEAEEAISKENTTWRASHTDT